MTVSELILRLQQCDPNARIEIANEYAYQYCLAVVNNETHVLLSGYEEDEQAIGVVTL